MYYRDVVCATFEKFESHLYLVLRKEKKYFVAYYTPQKRSQLGDYIPVLEIWLDFGMWQSKQKDSDI